MGREKGKNKRLEKIVFFFDQENMKISCFNYLLSWLQIPSKHLD